MQLDRSSVRRRIASFEALMHADTAAIIAVSHDRLIHVNVVTDHHVITNHHVISLRSSIKAFFRPNALAGRVVSCHIYCCRVQRFQAHFLCQDVSLMTCHFSLHLCLRRSV